MGSLYLWKLSTCLFSDCYCLVTDSKSHGLTLFWSSNASVFCNQWLCDSVSVCFSCFSSTKTCGLQSCRARTSWNGHLGGLSFARTNLLLDLSEPNCNSSCLENKIVADIRLFVLKAKLFYDIIILSYSFHW